MGSVYSFSRTNRGKEREVESFEMVRARAERAEITGFVVGLNEGDLLGAALGSLEFCAEVIYLDLRSDDDSAEIARGLGARVFVIEPEPVVEAIRQKNLHLATHDWIFFLDPDERVSPGLAVNLHNFVADLSSKAHNVGAVRVPYVFHVKDRPLLGTVWGDGNAGIRMVHRQRCRLQPVVHEGFRLNTGFEVSQRGELPGEFVEHLWLTHWRPFIGKHLRYLRHEGRDRLQRGLRTTFLKVVSTPLRQFYVSFVSCRGYRDGVLGFALSSFWAFYSFIAEFRLWNEQIRSGGLRRRSGQ